MQKVLQFGINNDVEIKREKVSGVLVDIMPIKADDSVCDIADLNKIGFDLILERGNQEPVPIVSGFLEDILIGLYSQTTKFELNKTKRAAGYKVMIDLDPACIELFGNDTLRLKLKAETGAFTALDTSKSNILVETIPAFGSQTLIPQLKMYPIGNGEVSVDKEVGSSVIKVTLLTDLASDYETSTKCKPVNVDIFANGYEKTASESLVHAENIHYMDFNPETDIQDLVLYQGEPMSDVRVKSKLDKAADNDAKLMVISLISA